MVNVNDKMLKVRKRIEKYEPLQRWSAIAISNLKPSHLKSEPLQRWRAALQLDLRTNTKRWRKLILTSLSLSTLAGDLLHTGRHHHHHNDDHCRHHHHHNNDHCRRHHRNDQII